MLPPARGPLYTRRATAAIAARQRRGRRPRQEVEVGALDELIGRDSQRCHEAMSLGHARLTQFALGQDDLKLQEVSEMLDAIEVNARPADQVEGATFADAPDLPV